MSKTKKNKKKLNKIFGSGLVENIFQKIISIGYEFETNSLCKFTYTDHFGDDEILVNTDSARKDIELFELDDYVFDEYDEDIVLRNEETVSLPSYNFSSKSKIQNDSNEVKFYITNDIADLSFKKILHEICGDEYLNNDMYKITTRDSAKDYLVHFVQTPQNLLCNSFTNVEWIFTYYQPKKSANIIIDTFVNAIQNLIYHLEQLEFEDVKLIYNDNDSEKEIVVGNPVYKKLFHLPDTNLYYLQLIKFKNTDNIIDSIIIAPQMTFSANIEDIWDIIKLMSFDFSIEEIYKIIIKVETCVNELITQYDETLKSNRIIFNYLCLILFKLNRYFTYLPIQSDTPYFKNVLFFNVRHSNYLLYNELKKYMKEHYGISDDSIIIEKILDLIVNETVLLDFFTGKHRKNLFNRTNVNTKPDIIVIDPDTKFPISRYGDPTFSFVSYFQFFEHPLPLHDENDNEIFINDWLVYKGIDSFSQTMDIRNNNVLVEVRMFYFLLSQYMSSYFTDFTEKQNFQSIGTLKKFINLYSKKTKTKKSVTIKTTNKFSTY